jgi:hypothetical protein
MEALGFTLTLALHNINHDPTIASGGAAFVLGETFAIPHKVDSTSWTKLPNNPALIA